jgi:HSP20 family protein
MLDLRAELNSEKEEKRRRYVEREEAYSSFQKVIEFPERILPSKAEGTMRNGVLEITIPKREPTSTKMSRIALK